MFAGAPHNGRGGGPGGGVQHVRVQQQQEYGPPLRLRQAVAGGHWPRDPLLPLRHQEQRQAQTDGLVSETVGSLLHFFFFFFFVLQVAQFSSNGPIWWLTNR